MYFKSSVEYEGFIEVQGLRRGGLVKNLLERVLKRERGTYSKFIINQLSINLN